MIGPLRNSTALALLLIVSAFPFCALAQAQRSAAHESCYENVDLSAFKNSQWAECDLQELQRLETSLAAEYRKLEGEQSPEGQKLLRAGQAAWREYREHWCRFEEAAQWAPGGIANYAHCLLEMTDRQIALVKATQM